MTTKLKGRGLVKSLVVGPLKKSFFCGFPKEEFRCSKVQPIRSVSNCLHVRKGKKKILLNILRESEVSAYFLNYCSQKAYFRLTRYTFLPSFHSTLNIFSNVMEIRPFNPKYWWGGAIYTMRHKIL